MRYEGEERIRAALIEFLDLEGHGGITILATASGLNEVTISRMRDGEPVKSRTLERVADALRDMNALPADHTPDMTSTVLLQEMIEMIDKFTALVRKDVLPAAERLDFVEANLKSLLDLVPSVRAAILQGQGKKD